MEHAKSYEGYPCRIVVFSNAVSFATYAIGAYIVSRLGVFWLFAYLLYILTLEIRLLSRSCVNCYYYGKFCAFGRGKISSLLFKKGNPEEFVKNKITWKDMIPDLLVSVIPFLVGVALLVFDFSWFLLSLVVALLLLASAGNGFVRGSLACKYCAQREMGCPAERLFGKK